MEPESARMQLREIESGEIMSERLIQVASSALAVTMSVVVLVIAIAGTFSLLDTLRHIPAVWAMVGTLWVAALFSSAAILWQAFSKEKS